MNKSLLILGFLFLSIGAIAQGQCEVNSGPSSFENNIINGPIILDPKGPINVTNNYSVPASELAYVNESILLLGKLMEDPQFRKLSEKEQPNFIKNELTKIFTAREKLAEERKGIALEKENLEKTRIEFKKEIEKQNQEFRKVINNVSTKSSNPLINQRIQELKTKGETIIQSANNCMSNDFDIVPIQDVNSGKIVYGFSLKEIRENPNYILVDDFAEGMARVKNRNKFGFYDSKGLKIDFKYDYAERFQDEVAVVFNLGKWFLINKKGERVVNFQRGTKNVSSLFEETFLVENKSKQFYISDKKGVKISKEFDSIERYSLNENLFIIKSGKRVAITNKGKLLVGHSDLFNDSYDEILPFTSQKFIARKKNLYSVRNLQGKRNSFSYFQVFPLNQFGIAKVTNIVNQDGKLIGGYGLIDSMGNKIVECQFDEIFDFDKNGIAMMVKDLKVGFLNTKGKIIMDCVYDFATAFDKNGISIFRQGDKHGLINLHGEKILPLSDFRHISSFNSHGLAEVRGNEKPFNPNSQRYDEYQPVGLVNTKGEIVLECKYDSIGLFDKYGYAKVSKNSKFGIINKKGQLMVDCLYYYLDSPLKSGLMIVGNSYIEDNALEETFRFGAINKNGWEFIPLIFHNVSYSSSGNSFQVFYGIDKFIVNHKGICTSKNAKKYNQIITDHNNKRKK